MTEAAVTAAPSTAPAATAQPVAGPAATTPDASASAPAVTAAPAVQAAANEQVYQLKTPDGFDAAAVPKLVELAKVYGLTPEKAQKLLDDTHAQQTTANRARAEAVAKIEAENLAAIKADKDYGGEKFEASMRRAQAVVAKLDARVPGLKARIEEVGNDPLIVRLFNVIGESDREDTFAQPGTGASTKPLHDILYGKT